MNIKVLKVTEEAIESTTPRSTEAMRIMAPKWKPNFRTSSAA